MNIFCSTLTSALGKQLGIRAAAREFASQVADPAAHDPAELLPVARVVLRLREYGDVMLYHGASTSLPKARSRAAHAALESKADLWVMVDDDVETDIDTLGRLVTLARDDRVSVLPCAIRGAGAEESRLNVVWASPLISCTDRSVSVTGSIEAKVEGRDVRRGGCGLVIVARKALERVTDLYRDFYYDDDDGVRKVALFAMTLWEMEGRQLWLNEDYSFCERLHDACVSIVAPIKGTSWHDGALVDLAQCASL